MARFYFILSVIGWTWAVLFFVWLAFRIRRSATRLQGFEVVTKDEEHV